MKQDELKKLIIQRQDILLERIQKDIDQYLKMYFEEKKDSDILTDIMRKIDEHDKCEKTDLEAYEQEEDCV